MKAASTGQAKIARVPSRQRTANEQSKGPTTVSGDQASDLLFHSEVFTFSTDLGEEDLIWGSPTG